MFVNGIPFVVSVLIGVNIKIVEYVSQILKTLLSNCIWKMFQFYKNNRYTIKTFLMDREFECIRDSLPEEENINTTSINEHVPEIELKNRVIKEHARALISTFSFKKIPVRIIIELIWFVGLWINQ